MTLARRAELMNGVRDRFGRRLAEIGPDLCRHHAGSGAATVSVFLPIRGEPDTRPLLDALDDAGFRTALPVTPARGLPLRFRRWTSGDPLAAGSWQIPEPLPDASEADPDVLFVPLAAFDRRGHRLGYGAGFYDNALARLRSTKPVLAIGVAFSVQEVEMVPTEPHDEPLDAIVTERDLILCVRS